MKKFIDKKKDAENKILYILNKFVKETGVSINFVDYEKEYSTGFNVSDKYKVIINLK